MAMRGIDISNNNKGLDLTRVDFDFAIMKTSQGTWFVDRYCDPLVQQCKRMGKPWGFYHYVEGRSGAEAEADFWIENTEAYFRDGLPCVDWEEQDNASWGDESYLRRFVQRVIDRTGVRPLIYAQESAYPWDVARDLGCGRWVAQYADMSDTGYQDAPWREGAYGCVIRQYSSCGRLDGWWDRLDLDKAYITAEQWARYADPDGSEKEEDMTKDEHDMLQVVYDVLHKYMGFQYRATGADGGPEGDDPVDMHQMIKETWMGLPKLLAMEAAQAEAIKALAQMQGADPEAVAMAVSDAVEAKLKTIRLEVTTARETSAAAGPDVTAEKAGMATA